MTIFDRYMFRLFVSLFGIFALILVLIYWVNQAVKLFDQIIADGQSAWVFWEFSVLSLPSVIQFVVPNAAFVAVVFATNRLINDSELTAVRSAGQSTARLFASFFYFAGLLFVLHSVLVHYLVPVSTNQLKLRQTQIAENATARLIRSGSFISPNDQTTYFIGRTTADGELKNVFLNIQTNPDQIATYMAETAFLVPTDTTPKLVLIDGDAQIFDTQTKTIRNLSFDSFTVDAGAISDITKVPSFPRLGMDSMTILKTSASAGDTKTGLFEIAIRLLKSASSVAAVCIAFCTVVTAKFNRLGVWLPFAYALFSVLAINVFEARIIDLARDMNLALWPLILPVVLALVWCTVLIAWADAGHVFKRKAAS